MEDMHWPLTVLSRAIHHKNLTSASEHIGLSQPQLSRLIAKLESELSVVLLDRSSKRKAGWTTEALKLGELYAVNSQRLQQSIQEVLVDSVAKEVSIASLEGLIPRATLIGHELLADEHIQKLTMDVYDLSELQEKYIRGEVDLILTSTLPGLKKYQRVLELGFQTIDKFKNSLSTTKVMSSYEYNTHKNVNKKKGLVVSNSLAVRKYWLDKYGGDGLLPSEVLKDRPQKAVPVYLLGTDSINMKLWEMVENIVQRMP